LKKSLQKTFSAYPRPFWVLMTGVFIDQLGANFIYPFFALFVTARFGVGLTQVGLMLGTMTAGGLLGGFVGGSLADRVGRKVMILFGLLVSGLFSTAIIFITRFEQLFLAAALVGFLGSMSQPARDAMLVDLLPEERRASGFGILRVVFNLTVAIGPLIGGLASDYSFNWLFIGDALTSAITFVFLLKYLPETKPQPAANIKGENKNGAKGYGAILRDRDYLLLLVVIMLTFAVLMQMLSTLSVFMRDVHGFPNKYYGYILSLNAGMVVLLQFWVSRQAEKIPPLLAMAIGSVFAAIGYGLFGFIQGIGLFALAMAILTFGEMILDPMSQTIASRFAPPDMRGRYMAAFGFSVSVSNLVTPTLAGLVIDYYDPNWIWYMCGIIGTITILCYIGLHIRTKTRMDRAVVNGGTV
jgi:MFS family permease